MPGGAAESTLSMPHTPSTPSDSSFLVTPSLQTPSQKPVAASNSSNPAEMIPTANEVSPTNAIQSQLANAKATRDTIPSAPTVLVPTNAAAVERAVAVPVRASVPSDDPPMTSPAALGPGNIVTSKDSVLSHPPVPEVKNREESDAMEGIQLEESSSADGITGMTNAVRKEANSGAPSGNVEGEQVRSGQGQSEEMVTEKQKAVEADPDINVLIARQLMAQKKALASNSATNQSTESSSDPLAGIAGSDTNEKKRCVEAKMSLLSQASGTVLNGKLTPRDNLHQLLGLNRSVLPKRREKRALSSSVLEQSSAQKGSEEEKSGSDVKRRRTSDENLNTSVSAKIPNGASSLKTKPTANTKPLTDANSGDVGPSKLTLRAVPAPGLSGLLPMLRSSPVHAPSEKNNASGKSIASPQQSSEINQVSPDSDRPTGGNAPADAESGSGAEAMQVEPKVEANEQWNNEEKPRKKKKVSWAADDKLVSIQYIDTRLELVKSWDPEFQITLPFAPNTLQMFKNMSEQQQNSQGDGSITTQKVDSMSSFEAARKKEHDMELERARKAREEQQALLNKMKPKMEWVKPTAIVLPTECRVEADSVRNFHVVEDEHRALLPKRRPDQESPPSPPPELRAHVNASGKPDDHVRLFPLSDSGHEASESGGSGNDSNRDVESNTPGYSANYNEGSTTNSGFGGAANGPAAGVPDGRNSHKSHGGGYAMGGQNGQGDGGSSSGMRYSGMNTGMSRPFAPNTMQHLLSALQNSGLLSHSGGNSNTGQGVADYGNNAHRNDGDGRADNYMNQHGGGGNSGDQRQDGGRNEGYMEDERRRGHEEGSGMSSGNGNMGQGPPPMMGGGNQMGGFGQGVQQGGMMEGFGFGMGPMGGPMGMGPNMMMPMGLPMAPVGMSMPFGMGGMGRNGPNGGERERKKGRQVETITRPKSKGSKQRKKCKYFGTKQGCRDGSSCVFAHN